MASSCLSGLRNEINDQLEELFLPGLMKKTIHRRNLEKCNWFQFKKTNIPQNKCKGLTQWAIVPLGPTLIYTTKKRISNLTNKTWLVILISLLRLLQWTMNNEIEVLGMIDLNPINILMTTSETTKSLTLSTTFHKPTRVTKIFVRFGYRPLKIC